MIFKSECLRFSCMDVNSDGSIQYDEFIDPQHNTAYDCIAPTLEGISVLCKTKVALLQRAFVS